MEGKGASLFPVAKGVQIPFIGKEVFPEMGSSGSVVAEHIPKIISEKEAIESKIAPGVLKQSAIRSKKVFKDKSKRSIDDRYLKRISDGLSFSTDVVEERVQNSKPYSYSKQPSAFDGLKKKKRKPVLVGRHDARFVVTKHYPCFIKGPPDDTLQSRDDIHRKPLPKIQSKTKIDSMRHITIDSKTIKGFTTKAPSITWDEYLMTLLSKETAEMVIKEYTAGSQQMKLNDILNQGSKRSSDDPASKSIQADELGRLKDSSADTTEEPTVYNKLEKAGKKSTFYVNQLNQGAFPIQKKHKNPNEIVLDTDVKTVFGKVLEPSFPAQSDNWYDWKSKSKNEPKSNNNKHTKGMKKWKDYPEVIEESDVHKMTLSQVTPTQSYIELDPKIVKKQREDANLVRIVQEWRGKWFLEKKWENSSCEELIDGMNDINDHVRLSAVSACSKALLNKKILEAKSQAKNLLLKKESPEYCAEVQVSTDVLEKIFELLSDRSKQVQVAAAITLFALNKANEQAKEILLQTLATGGAPEKWAAAQCLAYASCDADVVINELISHINSSDIVKHSKSVKLLGKLSKESNTVQFMLAEQLNSSSWRDRIVACQVFPSIQGPLSKDVANKISHLMWNDWSKDVRTAAARALGLTGNGKLVHDKLRERLLSDNEIDVLDALRKISFLGIMTGRLLPAFLKCLKSDYISVRLEAVKTVAAIRLTQEEAVDEILRLINEERNWKVKAHCIKAIGLVAKPLDNVQEVLLWCLRYEREAAIRAEACRAISNLNLRSERVVAILQDRLVVEEDPMVHREVTNTLNLFGLEPTGDLTMIKAIQKEVKRLCNRENIATAIVNQDIEERFNENKQKFLMIDDSSDNKEMKENTKTNSLGKMNGFDPILEGYKIRSQSKVSVPEIPVVAEPVFQYDGESELSKDDDSESDEEILTNSQNLNFDGQTIASYSTATTN